MWGRMVEWVGGVDDVGGGAKKDSHIESDSKMPADATIECVVDLLGELSFVSHSNSSISLLYLHLMHQLQLHTQSTTTTTHTIYTHNLNNSSNNYTHNVHNSFLEEATFRGSWSL